MEEERVGDPWMVLPIKNKLYAKNLIELHFSGRGLTSLINFKDFPNLEVVYLNKNKVYHYIAQINRRTSAMHSN